MHLPFSKFVKGIHDTMVSKMYKLLAPQLRAAAVRAYSTKRFCDVGQPSYTTHPQLLQEGEITPGITSAEYISRRERLLELLPKNSLAIVASAPVKMMTDVVPYTFRQNADYLYITGCTQPGGIAVLGHDFGLCMFMPEASSHDIIWQGQIAGVQEGLDTFKADLSYPISKIQKILPDMIEKSSKLFHNGLTAVPTYMDLDEFKKAADGGKVKDLSLYTHEARWIKSAAELKLMRETTSIACRALLQTMFHSKTFPFEGMLAAKFEYECKMRGAQRMAYNPVVGGGPNGSVIHYSRNDQKIKDGDLVLMDAGCELHGYVSDITRTWPPCGSFSNVQEELYELILETNKECVKLCRPGTSIRHIHNYSYEKLHKRLKAMGILKNDRPQSYHQLNPTSIGHYLGMDVHDCSAISYDRILKPGVVITIEPGVYIPLGLDVPDRYKGIGIRIEDDVLITESGYEVLTGSIPKEIKQLESLLANYPHGIGVDSINSVRVASSL
jgi:Xaa-Pro aminopeptidase